ncbi:hypothetical protein [Marinactinospora rubrisoli]|uniref:Uncharacterized protein n=1 Tax=Marinactinospora rubrisoli TaxID=2715399 RepID=A0ABW2KD38_9ACTN
MPPVERRPLPRATRPHAVHGSRPSGVADPVRDASRTAHRAEH